MLLFRPSRYPVALITVSLSYGLSSRPFAGEEHQDCFADLEAGERGHHLAARGRVGGGGGEGP